MSKQHKMTYKGKKYVTKFCADGCAGCIFFDHGCYDFVVECDSVLCGKNEDQKNRIWVEDKTVQEKTIDHAWLIEYVLFGEKKWRIWNVTRTRKQARNIANSMCGKVRVRKFVPAK